jgi:hypothetical protein
MALSNPLHGPRKEGTVGKPLPRVEVCYDFLVVRDIVKKDLRFILYCFMPLKAFFFFLRPRSSWMMVLKLKLELVSSVLEVHPCSENTGKDQRYDLSRKNSSEIHQSLTSNNVKYLLDFVTCGKQTGFFDIFDV